VAVELWQVLPSAADDYMYMYSSSKLQVELELAVVEEVVFPEERVGVLLLELGYASDDDGSRVGEVEVVVLDTGVAAGTLGSVGRDGNSGAV
jgi:hypothetical protein